MSIGFKYSFPAVRGKQAGREYFITMCPLKLIVKLFLFDEEELPPEYRAQRVLNKARVPDITEYIIENPADYVFSSLTASIDGDLSFDAIGGSDLGTLHIPMDSRFLLNDGQHRRAAIEEAIKVNPALANETISIVIFQDYQLERSQQMFADLNKHAVNTTKSIGILYESRDPMAILTKRIVDQVEMLTLFTDKENSSLSKFSPKIFTLSSLYNTNLRLINNRQGNISLQQEKLALQFWTTLCATIDEWKRVRNKTLTACDLRRHYVISHGIVLESIGSLMSFLNKEHLDWQSYIPKLNSINWSRSNTKDWQGRVFDYNGRISKSKTNHTLTTIRLKQLLDIPLTEDDVTFNKKCGER